MSKMLFFIVLPIIIFMVGVADIIIDIATGGI